MRKLSHAFCQPLGITVFAYVRVYPDETTSWLTSSPDQDRFFIESGAIHHESLLDTPEVLKDGMYLWFNDRNFPSCETFYRDRARLFQMDHGSTVVKHKKDYMEICCFSGLLAKRPLYNLFMNEKEMFGAFMENFTTKLDNRMLAMLEQHVPLAALKSNYGKLVNDCQPDREILAKACGWQNLLLLSNREKECLAQLTMGKTYNEIGIQIGLSARTVEHYLESVKLKLCIDTRAELFLAAQKLFQLGLLSK